MFNKILFIVIVIVIVNAKPSRISHNSIISWQDPILHDFACSLIELYQLGGWYLNANHGEIGYIYMTNNYNLMPTLNFCTTI